MKQLSIYLKKEVPAEPLAVFRIGFGLMMFASIIRFWCYGWIETLYIQPKFHFKFYGFEWVKVLGDYTYLLFIICGLAALMVAFGLKYRLAIVTFFLSFTYIELMDKTTYLNHYYFVSLVSFILIFLPANAYFSIDNLIRKVSYKTIPKWATDSLKLMLSIVYFYAGLAKLNSDWLFKAQPLKIWLTSKYDIPIIGETIMHKEWFHYAMSWSGAIYDLTIPFLLLYKRTRIWAFAIVVFFHAFTKILFPIGMFPFIMIIGTLIFFDAAVHQRLIFVINKLIQPIRSIWSRNIRSIEGYKLSKIKQSVITKILVVFFILQLLMPWRYLAYPDELFWTEEGYRFSWRVMLMEKAGYTNFKIVDGKTGRYFYVDNSDFLTSFQEKQMSFQPDFILEYAHYLGDHFKSQGHKNIQVFAESFVALNGRMSEPYIDSKVDLYQIQESFQHKDWILVFKDKIKGL
ncbi:MAG: HTTM domain-containing protein [Flavobacteriaceae bacterium]|nr:HTTM domain-containing protein [Flavobacteriaceae bacterium]